MSEVSFFARLALTDAGMMNASPTPPTTPLSTVWRVSSSMTLTTSPVVPTASNPRPMPMEVAGREATRPEDRGGTLGTT